MFKKIRSFYMRSKSVHVMMSNANLKSTAVMYVIKILFYPFVVVPHVQNALYFRRKVRVF